MKLVAQVIAGNSAHDLIGCIEHHRNMGVDAFIICHYYSEDKTLELLRVMEREHTDITVVRLPMIFDKTLFFLRSTIELACQKYDASWIIRIDSDERWFAHRGTLKEIISKEANGTGITAPRFNIVWPKPEAAQQVDISSTMALQDLPLALFPVVISPNELAGIPWVLTRIAPRCCMQANATFDFGIGGHNVIDRVNGAVQPTIISHNLVVAQIAFTTLARFEIKLRGILKFLEKAPANLNPNLGWHWTRLAKIYGQGPAAVEAEWKRQFMTPEFAKQLVGREVIASGEFAFDFSAKSVLET